MNHNDEQRGSQGGTKTYVAGNKPVLELMKNASERVDFIYFKKGRRDPAIESIIALCREKRVPFKTMDGVQLDRMYPGNHQGVLAQASQVGFTPLEELLEIGEGSPLPLIIALDKVQDTGNVGALARTLYAMGGAGLMVCRHHGAYLGSGAMRSSAGALNMLPVSKVGNMSRALQQCRAAGYEIYCTNQSEDSENIFEMTPKLPAVLVLGNEEKGVRQGVEAECTRSITIPMKRDFDSLNVAQAGAIITALFSK